MPHYRSWILELGIHTVEKQPNPKLLHSIGKSLLMQIPRHQRWAAERRVPSGGRQFKLPGINGLVRLVVHTRIDYFLKEN